MRRERIAELGNFAVDDSDLVTCCFADWSTQSPLVDVNRENHDDNQDTK